MIENKILKKMVVGNGLVAKKFKDKYDAEESIIIFASGVSHSKSTSQNEYDREFNLLKDTIFNNSKKHLVYFSTCSIYDDSEKETDYVKHKIGIENFIQKNVLSFNIFRISNLIGTTTNTNTILNYLYNKITENQPFFIWQNAIRNLIDIDDAYKLMDAILENKMYSNSITNIANEKSYSVKKIVSEIEIFTSQKAIYTELVKGAYFEIDTSTTKELQSRLGIYFDNDYLQKKLKKYFKY